MVSHKYHLFKIHYSPHKAQKPVEGIDPVIANNDCSDWHMWVNDLVAWYQVHLMEYQLIILTWSAGFLTDFLFSFFSPDCFRMIKRVLPIEYDVHIWIGIAMV